ncbi:MAG: DNA-binding response regulator [Actinobacteria bacterium RBG_16_68_21]|nr:MAG: DNA-binding response regulator [Actinobacteria bacterium RBG_16_68_21]
MRILLVEDEVRLAEAVRRGLEAEEFAVDLAHDGDTGLRLALTEQYDAIVLDILLPKMNGFRVCAEIRAADNWTPILMLTAKSGEYDLAEALDTGADDFISKPFSYVVLVARLRALIRRGSGNRGPVRRVGALSLDPAARRCERDGTEIQLTPREFALLDTLMGRSPDVVAKADLLDAVWGADSELDPNVVEVYVGYLRRKIDDPFGTSMLQTVRGVGYRVASD